MIWLYVCGLLVSTGEEVDVSVFVLVLSDFCFVFLIFADFCLRGGKGWVEFRTVIMPS